MKSSTPLLVFAIGVVLLGGALRLFYLNDRPMHCDEAILADKFGTLLETGAWKYDPADYHGPTLIYFSLIPAWISRTSHYADLHESTLRIVPAFFGLFLCWVPIAFRRELGTAGVVSASFLSAVSPVMVYYSRYYIPEMLLLTFSSGILICLYRYYLSPRRLWAAAGGCFAGLMAASKETAVLACLAFFLAAFITAFWSDPYFWKKVFAKINTRHLLLFSACGVGVAALLLSSFFSHPPGIAEFLGSFVTYARRAGQTSWHLHPWNYYFQLLFFYHEGKGPYWSEAFILLLALAGSGVLLFSWKPRVEPAALKAQDCSVPSGEVIPRRFLLVYTLTMTILYCGIRYKTPWCLINFWQPAILMAGVGSSWIFENAKKRGLKIVTLGIWGLGIAHLVWLSYLGNTLYAADPCNPYVYAHTGRDVFAMLEPIEKLAAVHPAHHGMPIQIFSQKNLWPLPWYLRCFSHQQWWREVRDEVPLAPVILATPEMEPALIRKMYELPPPGQREMYMWMYKEPLELRPQVEVRGYAAKSLWDQMD